MSELAEGNFIFLTFFIFKENNYVQPPKNIYAASQEMLYATSPINILHFKEENKPKPRLT